MIVKPVSERGRTCVYKVSLKAARVNAELTQEEAANALGKSKQTIVNWENGTTDIKFKDLERLAELYKVPIEMIRL